VLEDRPGPGAGAGAGALLEQIERRLAWVTLRRAAGAGSTPQPPATSAASLVTALWFAHLDAADCVALSPGLWPLFLATQHLLGNIDLRGGRARAEPGSGLPGHAGAGAESGTGAGVVLDDRYVDLAPASAPAALAAAASAAAAIRLVEDRFGAREPRRVLALASGTEWDGARVAELGEELPVAGLGPLTWILELAPGDRDGEDARRRLRSAGWHTVVLRHGRRREVRFASGSGKSLRSWFEWLDEDEHLDAGLSGEELRKRVLDGAPAKVARAVEELEDAELALLAGDLGGQDVVAVLGALRACDAEAGRPSALFAYTDPGRDGGVPGGGHDREPPVPPAGEQLEAARLAAGVGREDELARFPEYSPAGRWCAARARLLARAPRPATCAGAGIAVPARLAPRWPARSSTLDAVARLLSMVQQHPTLAARLALVEASVPARLRRSAAGSPAARGAAAALEGGRHAALLAAYLGLAGRMCDEALLPVAVGPPEASLAGVEALVEACRAGAGFLLAGPVPASHGTGHRHGTALESSSDGAGLVLHEPAYYGELDWLLAGALGAAAAGRAAEAAMIRLSERVLDQTPFDLARRRLGEDHLRRLVIAGAYVLSDSSALALAGAPAVDVLATGALVPEALEAAAELAGEGVAANVVSVTSPGRCYDSWRRSNGTGAGHLGFVARPGVPLVTVHDAPPRLLGWAGSALGVPAVALGDDGTGRPGVAEVFGSLEDRYLRLGLLPGQIVNAALLALERAGRPGDEAT
jgi:pyruvate dehydrogenase E1 component